MMGDNRGASDDSRFWGPVPRDGSSATRSRRTGRRSASACCRSAIVAHASRRRSRFRPTVCFMMGATVEPLTTAAAEVQPSAHRHSAIERTADERLPAAAARRREPRPPQAGRAQALQRSPPVRVRPPPRRALGRGRRRGRPRLPRRSARRRRRAVRHRVAHDARAARAEPPQRLQAAHARGARGALPDRHAHGRRRSASSRAARARSTPAGCTRRTSPRCATRCSGVARPGLHLPVRRLRGAATSATSSARSSKATRRPPRSPPPRSSPRSRATATCAAPTRCTRAGSSRRTSATRRPSTATRSSASAYRRCTA